ncbi:TonB-dependent receptor [Fulvivirga sp. RKSG066]|uniref:TonB-dependent receptor n=1 Tax=Fulvivirga aurantia TaxID=2529383 RepID=UPI0012BD3413|nr:carboxypeptidase regulatory-like domain-containing protein [Fulvivirga aurantia]MTI23111.1 TonB-dependent receptor [Fulvivirga aurantia]
MKKILLLCITLVVCMSASWAQGVTTASIRGQIVDGNGEGLPGATVIARHEPTGTVYGTSTRPDGRYNLPNLRIGGPYTVKATYIGYSEQLRDQINLLLGQVLEINFEMAEDITTLGEIVISGDNETFNGDRTGSAVAFDNSEIRKLPTITRSAQDIYRLTPSSDGNSFGGRNDQFNNFSLDGSIFNNPFGLDAATPGGQTDAQPISLDAIAQIQVATAPYDITQSGFTGASVNAVTKSGTNNVSGTVFGFYRSDALTGSKVDGEDVFVPDLTQLQTGFSIGGPIVKDKVFFFANTEIERRDNLGSSFFAARPGLTGNNVSRVTAADLETVAAELRDVGYEPGPYEGYTHETKNEKGIVKIDWNINDKNTLTATYNFLNASREIPANPTAIGRRGPDAITLQFFNSGYRINNKINSGLLELKSIISNKASNKFQIGYSAFNDSRDPFSAPFPVININKDGVRYIVAGHEPFSINNRLDQYVFQITNNYEMYLGDHTVTVGANFERFDFDNSFNLNAYGGTFGPGFASVADFVAYANDPAGLAADAAAAQATFDSNNANDTWGLAESTIGQFALYAQDRFEVTNNLTLTYGLRMDLPLYFDTEDKVLENIERKGGEVPTGTYAPDVDYYDEDGNVVKYDQTELPDQTPLLSPRVGFNWDVNNDKSLQIRGGTGLFTGRLPFVWIGNQVANPDFFFRTTTDPDFKFPRVWRSSLGIDKDFGKGLVATLDLSYTKDVNAQYVINAGLDTPSGNLAGVDNRSAYVPADKSVGPFGGPVNAYVFTNTDLGRSFNLTAEVKKNFTNGLFATFAYNFLDAKDASSLRAEITSDIFDLNPQLNNVNNAKLSNSIYGNRHRFVGTANKTFEYGNGKWATTLSLYYEYAQGGRFSWTYSGNINDDASANNDLIYIPTDNEIDQMNFLEADADGDGNIDNTAGAQRNALKAFIAQDDYLSENRGSYAERNAQLSPWFSRWDFRLLQDYNLNNGHTIQFSLDILNIGNLISSSWGVRQLPTTSQPIGVVNTVDAAGNPVYVPGGDGAPIYTFDPDITDSFTPNTDLVSRWQLQFGLRYSF